MNKCENPYNYAMNLESLKLLEQNGILRTLLLLLERQRYVTELLKSSINPDGIMSQDSLRKTRKNLLNLGLINEQIDEGPRPKTFLVITEKGRRIAGKLEEIQEILKD